MCAFILHQFEHCRPAVYGAFSRQALILLHFSSCQSAPGAPALAPGPPIARAAAVERRDRLADPVSSEESEREYPFPFPDQTGIGTISSCAFIWFQFHRSFQSAIGTISALQFIWFQLSLSDQTGIGTISPCAFIWFQFHRSFQSVIGTISALHFIWFQLSFPDQTGIGTISSCALIWFQFRRSFQLVIGTISLCTFIWFQFPEERHRYVTADLCICIILRYCNGPEDIQRNLCINKKRAHIHKQMRAPLKTFRKSRSSLLMLLYRGRSARNSPWRLQ